jgi:hypothetical protein
LLEKAGLVDDQHTARGSPERCQNMASSIVAHPVGIPVRNMQETLHTLRIGIADRLSELPAMLALDPTEQTEHVAPQPLTYFRARKAAGDAFVEIGEDVWPLVERNGRVNSIRCHTPSSA